MVCNWFNCTEAGLSLSECETECTASELTEYFCGLCENDKECLEFPDIKTKNDCETHVACILGLGRESNATSLTECEKAGYCSGPCYSTDENGMVIGIEVCRSERDCQGSGVCG